MTSECLMAFRQPVTCGKSRMWMMVRSFDLELTLQIKLKYVCCSCTWPSFLQLAGQLRPQMTSYKACGLWLRKAWQRRSPLVLFHTSQWKVLVNTAQERWLHPILLNNQYSINQSILLGFVYNRNCCRNGRE